MTDLTNNNSKYIAVAGNIGAGKSSLTSLLSKHFGWEAFYESVDDNPYLADFYEDMRRWSFNLQIYFLSSRFRHQKEMLENQISLIQDRTIYEDVEIFAKNLHEMSLMSDRDFKNYEALFHEMSHYLRPPDLLIYLRAQVPTLVNQIQQRGRDYENTIRIDYLERLNRLYEDWIDRYPHEKLIIETDDLDFVNDKEDLGSVIEQVDKRLFGLFN
ncbi:MAG TPA: deoxynucleoside kinase [Balneola sp.]|jgi:deoxyadenosine/deoxycytidine kinase|nr:deoxynucleoside kinase [Bacteroidota bacterium]MAC04573.1 deoxynucleoside kinase [Balneola sp.]MAO76719.1 deoxynucleoside kinase [Balneola sp.]MBF65126.1 deoxynucleoside kinase [Balneola sp.]HAH51408.1 deoxynucleoside kinase [Balneola sp.]|tara:strand:- start:6837 stop:7478 length:642 start_codon:yes stop_codon:yes gene_type:complete